MVPFVIYLLKSFGNCVHVVREQDKEGVPVCLCDIFVRPNFGEYKIL
jgi:hypothetical protein